MRYNAVLWEAERENKATQGRLEDYRNNNIKLLNIFIHTPLALSALVVVFMLYAEIDGFARLSKKLYDVPKISIVKPRVTVVNMKRYARDVRESVSKIHLDYAVYVLGGCYGLCFLGSLILSLNPAWKEERAIKDALQSNRYFDMNGEPWKAYWTPDAIIFHTYQCDPDSLVGNSKFWNTVNFKPDIPVQFKNDANKVIVARAYALPSIISFEIKAN